MPPSLTRRLLAGGLWVLLGKGITAGCEFVTMAILARLLSADGFGAYGLAFTVSVGGAMLAQLGVHQAVVRFVSEALGQGRGARARAAIGQAYRWCLVGSVLVAVVMLGGGGRALALGLWDAPELAAALSVLLAWLVARAFQVLTSEVFRGFQDLFRATLFGGSISQPLLAAALVAVLVSRGHADLRLVLGLAAAATTISVLIGAVAVCRRVVRLESGEALDGREMFGVAAPLWVNSLTAFALGQFDLWILGAFLEPGELGVYFAAARLVVLVALSLMLVNLVVPPFIGEMYFSGQLERLQRVLRAAATFAGAPAAVILAAFMFLGGPILALVYGDEFRGGATVLAILAASQLVNVLTGSCGVTLSMTGQQRALMTITVVLSCLAVGASLYAAPRFGMVGVAWVVGGARVAQNLAMWLAARRLTGLWTHVTLPRPADVAAILGRR